MQATVDQLVLLKRYTHGEPENTDSELQKDL